jgi:hypothetical protein
VGQSECGRFIIDKLEIVQGGNNTLPPTNLWNVMIYSHVHKSLPLDLSSARSIHILTCYVSERHFNILRYILLTLCYLIIQTGLFSSDFTDKFSKAVLIFPVCAIYPTVFKFDMVHPVVFMYKG